MKESGEILPGMNAEQWYESEAFALYEAAKDAREEGNIEQSERLRAESRKARIKVTKNYLKQLDGGK